MKRILNDFARRLCVDLVSTHNRQCLNIHLKLKKSEYLREDSIEGAHFLIEDRNMFTLGDRMEDVRAKLY